MELEFPNIKTEIKGAMMPVKLKLTEDTIYFKNKKTGKVEQISSDDLEFVNFQKLPSGTVGLRLFLTNGALHRFHGFKESDQEKLASHFSQNYNKDMLEKELSLKGWNWGNAKFVGSILSFDVGDKTSFEIPLNNASQCTTGKNEVTIEFHQNDDAPVSLLELRFHIPVTDSCDEDPVKAFHTQVMEKASIISASEDAIAHFRDFHCLTPRGRYDIKIFQSFFQLHGKTYDYKIPMSTILRLFLLPHKDGRQMFFVVSLDPPIKQGQTRYHYLVFLFIQDEESNVELPFSEDEMSTKFDNKLSKEISGPTYEVVGKIMKVISDRKLTSTGGFTGVSGTPAISCSFKAAAGFLYPLEKGFMFVHKPPLHIRFDEISSVNFARSDGSTRSFDFEIELTTGVLHTFSSIEKEEYGKLFDYINTKKLRVKNRGKNKKHDHDNFSGSDNEEPDAYLERVKAEAKERSDDDDDDESSDEDFNPNQEVSDVLEDYDSNPSSSDDSDAEGSDKEKKKEKKNEVRRSKEKKADSDLDDSEGENEKEKSKEANNNTKSYISTDSEEEDKEKKNDKKKQTKEKKPKSTKTVSETSKKTRKSKKDVDPNKPKRPQTAFMLFLGNMRETIKADNPGIKITEVSKKGGEMWKALDDKSEWNAKAAQAKREYEIAMKNYNAKGAGSDGEEKETSSSKKETKEKKSKKKKDPKNESPVKTDYKSKQYISDSDNSSEDDSKKKSKKRRASNSDEGTSKKKAKYSARDEDMSD